MLIRIIICLSVFSFLISAFSISKACAQVVPTNCEKNRDKSFVAMCSNTKSKSLILKGEGGSVSLSIGFKDDDLLLGDIVCLSKGWIYEGKFYGLEHVDGGYTKLIAKLNKVLIKSDGNKNRLFVVRPFDKNVSCRLMYRRLNAISTVLGQVRFALKKSKGSCIDN